MTALNSGLDCRIAVKADAPVQWCHLAGRGITDPGSAQKNQEMALLLMITPCTGDMDYTMKMIMMTVFTGKK